MHRDAALTPLAAHNQVLGQGRGAKDTAPQEATMRKRMGRTLLGRRVAEGSFNHAAKGNGKNKPCRRTDCMVPPRGIS